MKISLARYARFQQQYGRGLCYGEEMTRLKAVDFKTLARHRAAIATPPSGAVYSSPINADTPIGVDFEITLRLRSGRHFARIRRIITAYLCRHRDTLKASMQAFAA